MKIFTNVYRTLWICMVMTIVFFATYWTIWSRDGLPAGGFLALLVFVYIALMVCALVVLFFNVANANGQIRSIVDLPTELSCGDTTLTARKILDKHKSNVEMQEVVVRIYATCLPQKNIEHLIVALSCDGKTAESVISILQWSLLKKFDTSIGRHFEGIVTDRCRCALTDSHFWTVFFQRLNNAFMIDGVDYSKYREIGAAVVDFFKSQNTHFEHPDESLVTFTYKALDDFVEKYKMRITANEMSGFMKGVREELNPEQ